MILANTDIWAGVNIGEQLRLFSPELALIVTMLAIVTVPVLLGRSAKTVGTVASLGILVTLVLVLRVSGMTASGGHTGFSVDPDSTMLIADNAAMFFKTILMIFLACVTALWWMGSADGERDAPEFFVLLLGSALGMALMVSTTNLLMMVIAIETASLPSYAIVGFNKRSAKSAEASLKYVIFGAITAATMVYGVSLLYGLTGGSLEMADVARAWFETMGSSSNRLLASVAMLCVLVGVAFKISAVPLHFWCPDAFEGARIEVTTWLSVVSKAAGLILLTRCVQAFAAHIPAETDNWSTVWPLVAPLAWGIGIMAMVTCTWANFAAYKQTNVRRLLAYSSIAHAGYMLMACAVLLNPRAVDGSLAMSALLTYVVIYMFMNLGAFGVTAIVEWKTGSSDLESFTGLIRRAPALAVPMVVCLVSLVGLPPFAGFIGKWWVLAALGRQGTTLSWVLVSVAALNTLFSLYYYMRIVVQMTLKDDGRAPVTAPMGGLAMVNVCAVALLVLFVGMGPLKRVADRFAANAFITSPSASAANGHDSHDTLAERAP